MWHALWLDWVPGLGVGTRCSPEVLALLALNTAAIMGRLGTPVDVMPGLW